MHYLNIISDSHAWEISWTEEPGRLQSMGSWRVGHNWATSLSCIGEGNGNPLQCSCLENPRDGGACWAAVYRVTQSWTRLKRLSSSSSISQEHPLNNRFSLTNIKLYMYILFLIKVPDSRNDVFSFCCCYFLKISLVSSIKSVKAG